MRRTPMQRFMVNFDKVEVDGDTCWVWQGYCNPEGYGKFYPEKKPGNPGSQLAHRYAYTEFVGPIPEGCVVDHLCRIRSCVNPRHLDAVPQRINALRGNSPVAFNAAKETCVRGHELTGPNVRLYVRPRGSERICRACERERDRKNKAC